MTAAQSTLSGPVHRGPAGLPLPILIVLYAGLGLLPLLLATLQDQRRFCTATNWSRCARI